jgi:hypothetical protein
MLEQEKLKSLGLRKKDQSQSQSQIQPQLHNSFKTMKKILLTTIVVLCTVLAGYTQKAKKKISIEELSVLLCDCLKAKKVVLKNSKDGERECAKCLTSPNVIISFIKYAKQEGVDINNDVEMESLGEKIWIQLIGDDCAPFIKMFENEVSELLNEEDGENSEKITLTGKVLRIDQNDFTSVIIETENKREITLYWFRPFEDSDKYKGDKINKLIGQNISLDYKLLEVYLPKLGDYASIKEIVGITIQE